MPRYMTNPSGAEVIVTEAVERQLKNQGDWFKMKKREWKQCGRGEQNTILLDLRMNGLGDAIHAMPAIAQKIKDGFQVWIFCDAFLEPLFVKVGCINFKEVDNKILLNGFGVIYHCKMWYSEHEADCGAEPVKLSRFEQFAQIIETTLPEEFNFREYLL